MKDALFYLGLGLLCTHELDAMPNHEWRVLPVLRSVEDSMGEFLFLLAHIPLFAIIIGLVASLDVRRRALSRLAVSVFLVVHTCLHWLFSDHPHYEFDSLLSSSLIVGAGLCGGIFVTLELTERRPDAA